MFAAVKRTEFVLDMTISINHESFAAKTVKTTLFLVVSRCLYGPLL